MIHNPLTQTYRYTDTCKHTHTHRQTDMHTHTKRMTLKFILFYWTYLFYVIYFILQLFTSDDGPNKANIFRDLLNMKFLQSLVQPGEAVGLIAAQVCMVYHGCYNENIGVLCELS